MIEWIATLLAMGPRMWATLGNILKFSAVFSFLSVGLMGYRAIQLYQLGVPREQVWPLAGLAVVFFFVSVLLWNLKGPLVSGNSVARLLVGIYFLVGIIGSLGFNLVIIGVFYLFTGEPEVRGAYSYRTEQVKQTTYSPPRGFHATGHVGPSGAMAYGDEHRDGSVEIIDSWTPVQVVGHKHGLVEVVAATGQRGWIDSRTLTEVAA